MGLHVFTPRQGIHLIMAAYFYQLIGHVYTAAHTAQHDSDVLATLKGAGFGSERVKEGLALSKKAEELLGRKTLESPDNKTLEHNIHGAVGDLEMWVQSVKLKLRKKGFDDALIHDAVDHHLHSSHHTLSAVSQALRAIGVLRTLDSDQRAQLGSDRAVHDMICRGNTLSKKLYKVADDFVSPGSMVAKDDPLIAELDALMAKCSLWLSALGAANEKLITQAAHVGKTGYVPDGIGAPVGGAAFGVVLHQSAEQAAPNPQEATLNAGWSVGRQGNNENHGKGWVKQETFGTIMND